MTDNGSKKINWTAFVAIALASVTVTQVANLAFGRTVARHDFENLSATVGKQTEAIEELSSRVSTMNATMKAFGITPEELERIVRERRGP